MIEATQNGSVAILRLCHGKVSALDVEFSNALADAIDGAAGNAETGAIVLVGTDPVFSAGVDLRRFVAEGPEYADQLLAALDRVFLAVWTCKKPTVAALNGHAIAGGLVLAFACDVRIMASGRARVGVPEIAAGVPFPWLALELVRMAASPEHLPEMIALGSTFDADEARKRHLVQELVEPDALLDRAVELGEQLAKHASPGFDLQRQQLRGPSLDDPRRGPHDAKVKAVWRDAATRERVQSYLDQLAARQA